MANITSATLDYLTVCMLLVPNLSNIKSQHKLNPRISKHKICDYVSKKATDHLPDASR